MSDLITLSLYLAPMIVILGLLFLFDKALRLK